MDDVYEELVRTARRVSRRPDEARDLVQHAIAEALDRGLVDWQSPERRAWLRGVVRRSAALDARTAARRRRREAHWTAATDRLAPATQAFRWSREFLASLPRSVRALASLAAADLSAEEIRYALGLSGTAFRQRLCTLRGALRRTGDVDAQVVEGTPPRFALGPRRAELIGTLKRRPTRLLAVNDPDGHAIILCSREPHRSAVAGNEG